MTPAGRRYRGPMDAARWANVIALGALVLAAGSLAVAIAAWVSQREATQQVDRHATDALNEAREARGQSARAANAQERMALSMERAEATAAHRAPAPQVAWSITHHRGSTYVLENTGTATAYDIHIDVPGAARFDPPPTELQLPAHMPPHDSVTFGAVLGWGSDDTVVVTWADGEGSEHRQTWRRPLPPTPKK